MKFGKMECGAVTLMLAEAILRKLSTKVTHHPIARNFCDDTGRGDTEAQAIPLHDGRLRKRKKGDWPPVDQDMLGGAGQGHDGHAHGFVGGAQDIDLIDLQVIDHSDRPGNLAVTDDLLENIFA